MRAIPFALLAVVLSSLNLGCEEVTSFGCSLVTGDSWRFRVANNVRVTDSDAQLRNGPLALSSGDAVVAPAPTTAPSVTTAMLEKKMNDRGKAAASLAILQSHLGSDNAEVVQQKQLVAALDGEIAQLSQQAASHTAPVPSKPKTVLMITLSHTGPGEVTFEPGGDLLDRYSRIFCLFLDQPLTNQTVWATAENSMLIEYSPNTPPQRSYVGVEGSFKIISVKGNDIVADVKIKMRSDAEDLDATIYRFPYSMSGRHRFVAVGPEDSLYKSGAIQWMAPPLANSGIAAAPATQPVATAQR